MQFDWFTREQAAAYLARSTRMAESYGDRVAMERRLMPVTTKAERDAAIAYNLERARERLREALRG